MQMSCYYVVKEEKMVIEYVTNLDDAKRKAKNYASANKCTMYVLAPAFRYDPADAPVTETDLSAQKS